MHRHQGAAERRGAIRCRPAPPRAGRPAGGRRSQAGRARRGPRRAEPSRRRARPPPPLSPAAGGAANRRNAAARPLPSRRAGPAVETLDSSKTLPLRTSCPPSRRAEPPRSPARPRTSAEGPRPPPANAPRPPRARRLRSAAVPGCAPAAPPSPRARRPMGAAGAQRAVGRGGGGGRPRPLAGRRPMAERGKRRRAEQGAARGRAGRGGARRAGSAVGCSTFSGAVSRRPRPSAAVRGPARAVRPFRRLWAFPAASPRAAPRQRWGWRPGGDTPGASLAVAVSPRWLLCRGPPSAPPACRWREGGGTGEQRPWAFLGGCPQPEAWERRALALAWCCKTVPTCPGLRWSIIQVLAHFL